MKFVFVYLNINSAYRIHDIDQCIPVYHHIIFDIKVKVGIYHTYCRLNAIIEHRIGCFIVFDFLCVRRIHKFEDRITVYRHKPYFFGLIVDTCYDYRVGMILTKLIKALNRIVPGITSKKKYIGISVQNLNRIIIEFPVYNYRIPVYCRSFNHLKFAYHIPYCDKHQQQDNFYSKYKNHDPAFAFFLLMRADRLLIIFLLNRIIIHISVSWRLFIFVYIFVVFILIIVIEISVFCHDSNPFVLCP